MPVVEHGGNRDMRPAHHVPWTSAFEQRSELESEFAAGRRNASREKIQWMTDCEKVREKMRHACPQINLQTRAIPIAV
jgi:hypothetical protein